MNKRVDRIEREEMRKYRVKDLRLMRRMKINEE
jgi:hypothetical protein